MEFYWICQGDRAASDACEERYDDTLSRNTQDEMYRCTLGEAFGFVPRSTALRCLSLLDQAKGCNDQDADCLLCNIGPYSRVFARYGTKEDTWLLISGTPIFGVTFREPPQRRHLQQSGVQLSPNHKIPDQTKRLREGHISYKLSSQKLLYEPRRQRMTA